MSVRIKKGDNVKVIAGKSRGAFGKVLSVSPAGSRVVVEGVRLIKRHTKRSQSNPDGGIIEREAAIHISNVALVTAGENK
ncbi:MAG: 50S ribosomal protein L24 [Verrucomicrobiota bacterium]